MGRRKKNRLAEKPLNIRLYEESYRELKEIAERDGLSDSDVHRELVAEALNARRETPLRVSTGSPNEMLDVTLEKIEGALSGLKSDDMTALRDEVQTLSSRVAYLCDQIALLINAPKRRKTQADKTPSLFS